MSIRVRFQNGADAPEIILAEEFDEEPSKEKLAELAHIYGTVEDATAWIDGRTKPKTLRDAEEEHAELEAELASEDAVVSGIVQESNVEEQETWAWPSTHAELDDIAKTNDFAWPEDVSKVSEKQEALTAAGFQPPAPSQS